MVEFFADSLVNGFWQSSMMGKGIVLVQLVGSIVVVKDLDEDCEDKYEIVGSQEANPREGRISDDSPVGKGLIGHRAGETLAIPVPSGEVRLEIISVQNL